jgi:hypothetical protein
VGSGATAFSSGESKLYAFLAIAGGLALWLLAGRLLRLYLKNNKAEDVQAPVVQAAESIPVSK